MGNPGLFQRYAHWALFVVFALVFMFLDALPFNLGGTSWPGPQLLVLMAIAWVLRRPDYVPIVLFGLLALMADMFQLRPPGLMAGLLVVMLEFLRTRHGAAREWPFVLEWAFVAMLLAIVLVANRLLLGMFAVTQPALGIDVQQFLSSIAAYPAIVGLSVWALGIRRLRPGEGSSYA